MEMKQVSKLQILFSLKPAQCINDSGPALTTVFSLIGRFCGGELMEGRTHYIRGYLGVQFSA